MKYDKLLTAAEKIHVAFLRILTVLLTLTMWLMAAEGIFTGYRWIRYGASLFGIVLLVVFSLLYVGFQCLLVWLSILCRRLRIAKRVVVWTFMWIPVVNFGLALYVRGLARQEIDHTLYKINLDNVRAEAGICGTAYPLLMVHGVGFRDFRYFNYWGRIPRELVRNGAKVYYGHQEAWGTVESNAQVLKEKIWEIQRETGCGKVNIIAHSKGGLDSRYLISALDMAEAVASLTTINTPHQGSMLVDLLKGLPDGFYRMVCRWIDQYFGRLGDQCPDAYRASYQLSAAYAREFNQNFPDVAGVYYQSYGSIMKSGFGSKLLCVPYWVLKLVDGPNDGLVTDRSAVWTNFKGVLTSSGLRGISHGDMIDLTREDYQGFDVLEFYVKLVEELKQMGF